MPPIIAIPPAYESTGYRRFLGYDGTSYPGRLAVELPGSMAIVDEPATAARPARSRLVISGVPKLPISQLAWEIDPNGGDDGATGLPGAPLATFAEFFRRLDLFRVTQTVTATLLADTDEDVCARADFEDRKFVRIVGATTVYCTGAITASTAWDDATNSEVYITVGSLSGGHTASQLVGRIVRINAGARAGNWAVVTRNTTGSVLRCAGWSQADLELGVAQVGDTFDVLDFVHASGEWTFDSAGSGLFWIENLELGAQDAHSITVRAKQVTLYQSIANGCDALQGGRVYAFGSYLGHGPKVDGGVYVLDRSAAVRASGSPFEIYEGGGATVLDQCVTDGYALGVYARPGIKVEGSLSICNATEGLVAEPGALINQPGYLWFRDTVTRLIRAAGGVHWSYGPGRDPVHVGSTSPALGTLAGTAIAAIPQTDAGGLSNIVEKA